MIPPQAVGLILVIVALILFFSYQFYAGRPTVPPPSYKSGFQNMQKEGFFGGVAKGSGVPDCSRTSAEASELIAIFMGLTPTSDFDAQDNLREFNILVGKLACFKKDLVSPSYIIDATKKQQYVSSHDIEPIAETTGRCFAKTISPRDLELAFDKWTVRGTELLRRLCSTYRVSDADVQKASALFDALVRDVKDVARGACLQGEPMIAAKPGPRDAHPYEKPGLTQLGEYNGYY
jgi:hypothetical protein